MLGVNAREHRFLAEQLVVVFLGLGDKPHKVIGVADNRAGRAAQEVLVDPAHAPRAGRPSPFVISPIRIGVAIADETGAARLLRREHRVQPGEPVASGPEKVRIDRQRLDLGAADQGVAGVVADLHVEDRPVGLVIAAVFARAVVEAKIVVVGTDRPEGIVPDNLLGGVRVVHIHERERLAGDVAGDAPMVGREPHLRGVFFGRFLVRWRPLDALGGDDLHRHAALHLVVHAWRDQILDLGRVLDRDKIAGFDLCTRHRHSEQESRDRHHSAQQSLHLH